MTVRDNDARQRVRHDLNGQSRTEPDRKDLAKRSWQLVLDMGYLSWSTDGPVQQRLRRILHAVLRRPRDRIAVRVLVRIAELRIEGLDLGIGKIVLPTLGLVVDAIQSHTDLVGKLALKETVRPDESLRELFTADPEADSVTQDSRHPRSR